MNAVCQLCTCFTKNSFMLETLCAMTIRENMIREAIINDVNSIAEIIVNAWQNAYEGIIDPD